MDMWKVLEINATTDITAIKKAYAKKLKVHHPEDDPTGFQSLKESYDSAVQYAKYMSSKAHSLDEDNSVENARENQHEPVLSESSFNISLPLSVNRPYDKTNANREFLNQLNSSTGPSS